MESYSFCPFVTGLFHLALCPQGSPMLYHMSNYYPFLWLSNTRLYIYTTFCLSLHPLINTAVFPPFVNNAATDMVGKISFEGRRPNVLELSKGRAQEPYMDEPCVWRGSVSIQSALFWGGLGWEEGIVSWAWGGLSKFEGEGTEGREMPDFIFLILCPAQAWIAHFVDLTLELLLGHWRWFTNYNIVQIALGVVFTHSSRLTSLLHWAFSQGTPSSHQQPPRRVRPLSSAIT